MGIIWYLVRSSSKGGDVTTQRGKRIQEIWPNTDRLIYYSMTILLKITPKVIV